MKAWEGKKLGVIGGLGPKATAYFFDLVVDNTKAESDQDHIDAIYLNHASMPDRTRSILFKKTDRLKELLIADAKLLQSIGVSYIAIPCNTSHYLYDDIQKAVKVPVINMIDETLGYISQKYGKGKVGVLATTGTREMKIYDKYAQKYDIEIVYPSQMGQQKVMEAIYNGVKAGKDVSPPDLDSVISELKDKGCMCVVLACTELSVIWNGINDEYIVDSLLTLARRAIVLCGKEIKN